MPLEDNVLDAKQEAYIAWLVTAPSEREPSSKQKYADHIGVNVVTLRRWEKRDVFRKEWQSRVDDTVGSPERTQALLDRLYENGLGGDTKAADLYFRVTGRLAPQPITVRSEKVAAELSDAELAALVGQHAENESIRRAQVALAVGGSDS